MHYTCTSPSETAEKQDFIKAEKCEFLLPQLVFLEYIISKEGVVTGNAKKHSITNWPMVQNVKEQNVQRHLGFAYSYWRLIREFSSVTAPLISLLKGRNISH